MRQLKTLDRVLQNELNNFAPNKIGVSTQFNKSIYKVELKGLESSSGKVFELSIVLQFSYLASRWSKSCKHNSLESWDK